MSAEQAIGGNIPTISPWKHGQGTKIFLDAQSKVENGQKTNPSTSSFQKSQSIEEDNASFQLGYVVSPSARTAEFSTQQMETTNMDWSFRPQQTLQGRVQQTSAGIIDSLGKDSRFSTQACLHWRLSPLNHFLVLINMCYTSSGVLRSHQSSLVSPLKILIHGCP